MICKECGNVLLSSDKVCKNCGCRVETIKSPPPPPRKDNNLNKHICKNCNEVYSLERDTCPKCGVDVDFERPIYSQNTSQQSGYYDSSYNYLGGWLALFAYGNLVGVVGIIAVAIWGLVTLAPLVKYSSIIVFSILLLLGICAFGTFWWIKIFLMIKDKDCRILKFYEICAIVYMGYELLTVFSGGFTTNIIGRMLVTIIGQLIIELYFRNSVRVRTYFGSDEFIRCSLFKNWGISTNMNTSNYLYNPPTTDNHQLRSAAYTQNEETVTFCANCGAKMLPNFEFCGKCGTKK